MSRSHLTSRDYQELLDNNDFSTDFRHEYERLRDVAAKREAVRARIGEEGNRKRLIRQRQGDTVRELLKLFAKCFEVAAWMKRERRPPFVGEALNKVLHKLQGMSKRLSRAHSEASAGCPLQIQWLADHAELIAAVESFAVSLAPKEIPRG